MNQQKCNVCDEVKPITAFYKGKKSINHDKICRYCRNKRRQRNQMSAARQATRIPERVNEYLFGKSGLAMMKQCGPTKHSV